MTLSSGRKALITLGLALLVVWCLMQSAAARRVDFLSAESAASSSSVRLAIDRRVASPGGKVRVRIENHGSEDVASTPRYGLSRRTKGTWVNIPTGPFFAPRTVVRAETSGPWQAVHLPNRARAGVYRIRKWVELVEAPRGKTPIQAKFRVHRQ